MKNKEAFLRKQFVKQYKPIKLTYEYPGYSGEVKYMLVTSESEEEILQGRYESIINDFVPFILVSPQQWQAMLEDRQNNDKHRKRNVESLYFIEGETEKFIGEIPNYESEEDDDFKYADLYKAIDMLTSVEKKRIIDRYFNEREIIEIAKEEGVSSAAIVQSIKKSLKKLRKFMKMG